jgi:pimeloyl-ACP methyl ester carboxylesterase
MIRLSTANAGHTIWEWRPKAFDDALLEFVYGTARSAR